jgi:Protein of unknown function (DUF4235)
MADKGGKAAASLAAFAAAYGTRRLVAAAWQQVTGKAPPADPHDQQVTIGEALTWAVLTGAAIEAARVVAIRLASRKARELTSGPTS